MTLTDMLGYGIEFLPEFAWTTSRGFQRSIALFAILIVVACIHWSIVWATTTWSSGTKNKLHQWSSFLSLIVFIGVVFKLAAMSNCVPFPPLYILLGLFALVSSLIILLVAAWIVARIKMSPAPPFFPYLKVHFWHSMLSSSHFILPFVLFNMPLFDHSRQVVYLGIPLLMLAAYLVYFKVLLPNLFKLMRLNLPVESLSSEDKEKFLAASASVREIWGDQIFVAKTGLVNAVALCSEKKIIVGYDIIKCLSAEELRAVMIHELGHMKDRKFIPRLSRNSIISDLLVFLFCVLSYSKISNARLFSFVILAIAIWLYAVKNKAIRLQAEIVADSFVKETEEDLHAHLVTGLKKMHEATALDKDHCKKNDVPHLDIDERVAAVNDNKPVERPSRIFQLATGLAFIFLATAGGSFIFDKAFPSPEMEWNSLHDRFHDLDSYDVDSPAALKTISKALDLAQTEFGQLSEESYLCLNDLAEFHLYWDRLAEAENYSLQAYDVGRKIYGPANRELVRALDTLGEVRQQQNDHAAAVQLFEQALKIQQQSDVEPEDAADTFELLVASYMELGLSDKVARVYDQLLEIYSGRDDDYGKWMYLNTLLDYADFMAEQKGAAMAQKYYEDAIQFADKQFSKDSWEYVNALKRSTDFFNSQGKYELTENLFRERLKFIASSYAEESEPALLAMYDLAEAYRNRNALDKAENLFTKMLLIRERAYGKDSEHLIGELWKLGLISEKKGDLLKAEEFIRRVAALEKPLDYIEDEKRIETNEKLRSLLKALGKTQELKDIEKELVMLKAKNSNNLDGEL